MYVYVYVYNVGAKGIKAEILGEWSKGHSKRGRRARVRQAE